VGADNVGWRDQRFFGTYERTGRFVISGLWDEILQFYSIDTQTPYVPAPGDSPLALDDSVQRAIQNGQANLNAYVPIATQFDLHERRDIGNVTATATPTREIDINAAFTTTRHTGELPWGASFGFSNDVEVALPYDSRTNDFSVGAEWMNNRGMLRVAYDGSWFNNLDDTLTWDSPLRLDDSTSAPGRGRMQDESPRRRRREAVGG
jgi:Putative outer membrane beta-barrel porin, MtrB/PioB